MKFDHKKCSSKRSVNDNKKQKFVSLSECNHKFWVCYLRIDGENVCKPPFLTGWWLQPLFKKKKILSSHWKDHHPVSVVRVVGEPPRIKTIIEGEISSNQGQQ
jgi:hypothetical protein